MMFTAPWYAKIIAATCASIDNCCYVEIGVDTAAASMKAIILSCSEAHGCDIKDCPGIPPSVKFWQMPSQRFLEKYAGRDPDVVFIDADHSYKAVTSDFDGVVDRWPNAIIFLHDSWPTEPKHFDARWGGVWRLRKEIEKSSSFEVFTWKTFPGLTAVRCTTNRRH